MTQYKFEWPKGAELKMDKKDLDEIKKTLELQFKHIIYSQPGFKYYPAMGNTNFFQHFKTNDGIDLVYVICIGTKMQMMALTMLTRTAI